MLSGDWAPFAATFTEDARMAFSNVPVGPFHGRAQILDAYLAQPPTDTMRIRSAEELDADTDRVLFDWDHGGPGTMTFRWRGGQVADLEIAFG